MQSFDLNIGRHIAYISAIHIGFSTQAACSHILWVSWVGEICLLQNQAFFADTHLHVSPMTINGQSSESFLGVDWFFVEIIAYTECLFDNSFLLLSCHIFFPAKWKHAFDRHSKSWFAKHCLHVPMGLKKMVYCFSPMKTFLVQISKTSVANWLDIIRHCKMWLWTVNKGSQFSASLNDWRIQSFSWLAKCASHVYS